MELAVAMLEAGHQTTMGPKALNTAVVVLVREDLQQFRQDGERRGAVEGRGEAEKRLRSGRRGGGDNSSA